MKQKCRLVTVSLSPESVDLLDQLAELSFTSRSQLVRLACENYLAKQNLKP